MSNRCREAAPKDASPRDCARPTLGCCCVAWRIHGGRMSDIRLTRRRALGMLACVVLVPRTAVAQDPRATVVQKVARDWLALADALDGTATWNAAGPRFQQAISAAK